MKTFSRETCERLAKVLGEKTPITKKSFWVSLDNKEWKFSEVDGEVEGSAPNLTYVNYPYIFNAFRLDDLDRTVWEEIGNKLGWFPGIMELNAHDLYDCWLKGGYPAADEYLKSLLPE